MYAPERAWLIEQPSAAGGPRWLAVGLGAWYWTRSSREAFRFASRDAASGALALLAEFQGDKFDMHAEPREHEWHS